jgi:hypothetical protein
MPSTITGLVDQSLADWESKKLNCHPGAVPEAMRTGEVQDDWKYWRAISSTVQSPMPTKNTQFTAGTMSARINLNILLQT